MEINEIKFGHIQVSGKRYGQVLIIGDQAFERDEKKLEEFFGTTHRLGQWEIEALGRDQPDYIIIGNGYSEALEVRPEDLEKLKKSGAEILILPSPVAARRFNKLAAKGKKVNLLIHATC